MFKLLNITRNTLLQYGYFFGGVTCMSYISCNDSVKSLNKYREDVCNKTHTDYNSEHNACAHGLIKNCFSNMILSTIWPIYASIHATSRAILHFNPPKKD